MHSHFLLVDKPKDWTSHDVVAYIRRIVKSQALVQQEGKKIRVGHSGTLDPFATGLLIVGIGREATKRLDEFKGMDKCYEAVIHLGATSDTQDSTGNIQSYKHISIQTSKHDISEKKIKEVIKTFIGKQQQIPPMFSAKKVGGKKLYDLARQGKEVERTPQDITIYNIEFIAYQWPLLTIRATVSTGTYIRTLAHDIGKALGTGAYCEELRRMSIGKYHVDNAADPKKITPENWSDHLII